jgi:hypothetical protein
MNTKTKGTSIIHDYIVVLRNDHKQSIEKTGWLLSVLILMLLGFSIYTSINPTLLYITLAITLSLMTSNWFEKRKKKNLLFKPILIAGGIGLIVASSLPFVIGVLLIICGLIEKTIVQKRELGFSKNAIQENGLFGKKINWNELNRVVLKDDILTIDFKNNKLIQVYTDNEDDDEYEVGCDEFNAYCQNRIDEA